MIPSALLTISEELDGVSSFLSGELRRIATEMVAYKRRGPQRKTRWHRRSPVQRRKRRRWERTTGGRAYKRKKRKVEKRPTVKRYRKRLRTRGVHRKYPWLR